MADLGHLRMEEVPDIPVLSKIPAVIIYAPLGDTPFDPDVVIFVASAARLMLLHESAISAGAATNFNTLSRPTCRSCLRRSRAGWW